LARVANIGGELRIDRVASGRGAWICRDTAVTCVARAARSKGFDRALRATFPPAMVAALVVSFEILPLDVAD
jgi:predicted RNA-binding protein YlxR (DUF448 family)